MDCLHIPELAYSDFGERLYQKVAGQRIPFLGSLELTFRCNLRCQHCYVSFGHHGLSDQQELTYPEIQNLLDQAVDENCLWFLLTGGEPLMRRDFAQVYTYAKRKGLLVTLFTNGTLLTPRLADVLAEWRPHTLEITLYGHTQQTYERITGVPGSYARCRRGIDLLLERKLPLKLKTMLMTLNQHELAEMKDFAASLGVEFRFDPMLNSGLQGFNRPLELRLPPDQVVQHDLADAQRVKEWKKFSDRFLGMPANERTLYQCGAGLNSFHVDPYGQLSLCMISRLPAYDLRQGSFHQGWTEFLRQARFRPPAGPYACGQCKLLSLCGQCPGWATLEHGRPQQRVEYLCQVAHLRAHALGLLEEHENAL